MLILLDTYLLDQEADRLDEVALELIDVLTSVAKVLDSPGLPPWVAEHRAIIPDLQRQLGQVLLSARMMRVRSLMARLAEGEGMGMFALRMATMEYSNPKLFRDAVINSAMGEFLSLDAERRSKALVAFALDELDRQIRLTPDQARRWNKRLNVKRQSDAKFLRTLGMNRAEVKAALDRYYALDKVRNAALAVDARLAGKLASDGFGLAADLFLQWAQDRKDHFEPGDKAARMGVTAAGNAAGVFGGMLACGAVSGGTCIVATAAMGLAANYASGGANERWFPSKARKEERAAHTRALQEFAREVKQQRKLERWYQTNGSPSKAFLDDRLIGARVDTTRLPGGQKITNYYRPGTDELLAQRQQGPGYDRMQHFDPSGKRIDP